MSNSSNSDSAEIATDSASDNNPISYIKLHDDNVTQIKYIYHISDIHIRNTSRHDEYREVFEKTYNILRDRISNKNAIIVLTGDIMHTKTELSPEAVSMAAILFKNLSTIAPVILIPGNHDMNLSNKNRMDALTPIVEDIGQLKNFYYLKKSGIYQYNNLVFGYTSVIDDIFVKAKKIQKQYIKKIKQKNIFKIALYHGPVHGSELDVGFRMNREELTVKDFVGYDYGLLGDIHKYQYLDDEKTIAYSGSLIQQSYGESMKNHGILMWDLYDNEHEFINVKNNYGYCTVNITDGILEDITLPKNPRLRFILENTNKIRFEEILKELKKKYNISEVVIDSNHRKTLHLESKNSINKKSAPMTAFSTQRSIISDYLRSNGVADSVRKDLLELHQEIYQKILEKKKDAVGDIHHLTTGTQKWKILELKFSNTLSYGENNYIDFRNYDSNKIIGIIAPNFHGKTAVLDVILFCLFDKFSRGDRRDILNKDRNKMYCSLLISIGNDLYQIERIGQRSKNGLTVKIDVNFDKIEFDENKNEIKKSLNGLDKNDTNKKICEMIGEYNDYILTAFSLNLVGRTSNFGDMTQLQKKEYLNEILKLNIFEDCNNYAKEKVKKYALEIKTIEQYISTKSIDDMRKNIDELLLKNKHICSDIINKKNMLEILDEISDENKLDSLSIYADLSEYDVSSMEKINHSIKLVSENINKSKINNIDNINNNRTKEITEYEKISSEYDELESDPDNKSNVKKRQKLLDKIQKIPSKKLDIADLNKKLMESNDKIKNIDHKLKQIDISTIDSIINEINEIKNKINQYRKKLLPAEKNNLNRDDFDKLIESNKLILEKIYNEILSFEKYDSIGSVSREKKEEFKIVIRTKADVIDDLHTLTLSDNIRTHKSVDKLIKKYTDECEKLNKIISLDDNLIKPGDLVQQYHREWMLNEDKIQQYYDIIASEHINRSIEDKIILLEKKLDTLNVNVNNKIIVESLHREREILIEHSEKIKEDIEMYNETQKMIETNSIIEKEINLFDKSIEDFNKKLSAMKSKMKLLKTSISDADKIISENKSNLDTIEKKKHHLQLLLKFKHEYSTWLFKFDRFTYWNKLYENIKRELDSAEKETIRYESQIEMHKRELNEYMKNRNKYDDISSKLTLYNTYVNTMNYNGLPYEILKKYLPMIEESINNILHSMVDFSVEFVFYDENKLKELKEKNVKTNIGSVDLNIVRYGKKPYNIQIVSGFEKFIIGLAIRMALMQISLTAKPNFFVIDEGWGSIDSEHINNIGPIMNFIKNQYDHVIIISHLEPLKNEVDYEINIDRKDGFSYLRKSNLKLIKKQIKSKDEKR